MWLSLFFSAHNLYFPRSGNTERSPTPYSYTVRSNQPDPPANQIVGRGIRTNQKAWLSLLGDIYACFQPPPCQKPWQKPWESKEGGELQDHTCPWENPIAH